VDIILGGNPVNPEEQKKVIELGGLHVLGTERHESRRIDNQLRGRAGRQGDSGSSQFYVSMEDDLMRIFGSDRMKNIMTRLGVPEDMPIENGMISKSIEAAQRKVEGHNFDIRKHLLDYDDVLNKHREVIYKRRKGILGHEDIGVLGKKEEGDLGNKDMGILGYGDIEREEKEKKTLKEVILGMVEGEIEQMVLFHTAAEDEKAWNIQEIYEVASTIFPIAPAERKEVETLRQGAGSKIEDATARTKIIEYLFELAKKAYDDQEAKIKANSGDEKLMRQIEVGLYLRSIDTLWIEHLEAMDHLRHGIGLRGYGQRDPLVEYKKESYRMFNELLNLINKQIVYSIYKVGFAQALAPSLMERGNMNFQAPAKEMAKGAGFAGAEVNRNQAIVKEKSKDAAGKKIGQNDPCTCGSGKKYKKCCGK